MSSHEEDVLVWPDEEWCFRCELWEYPHKSDDYQVIPFDSGEWYTFLE